MELLQRLHLRHNHLDDLAAIRRVVGRVAEERAVMLEPITIPLESMEDGDATNGQAVERITETIAPVEEQSPKKNIKQIDRRLAFLDRKIKEYRLESAELLKEKNRLRTAVEQSNGSHSGSREQ